MTDIIRNAQSHIYSTISSYIGMLVESDSFSVAKKPRQAMIAPVEDPTGTRPARHVELAECAYSPDGCCEEEEMTWFSSLQGYLGTGNHLIANDLMPGDHVISLVAPVGCDE